MGLGEPFTSLIAISSKMWTLFALVADSKTSSANEISWPEFLLLCSAAVRSTATVCSVQSSRQL